MLFTSIEFLFLFLPLVLVGHLGFSAYGEMMWNVQTAE